MECDYQNNQAIEKSLKWASRSAYSYIHVCMSIGLPQYIEFPTVELNGVC